MIAFYTICPFYITLFSHTIHETWIQCSIQSMKAPLSLCNLHLWEEWQVLFIRHDGPIKAHIQRASPSSRTTPEPKTRLDNSSDCELKEPFGECTYCQNSCRARGHKPPSTDTCLQKCGLIQKLFTQRHMFKLLQFKTLGEINTQLQQQQPETIKMAFQGVRAFQAFTEKTFIVL